MRLSLALLFLALPAHADEPGCSFHVDPSVYLALDGPIDVTTHKPELMGHWAVNCGGECAPNWGNSAQLTLLYTATSEIAFDGSADEIDQRQSDVTVLEDAELTGARLTPIFTGGCGDPLQSTGASVQGAPFITPPFLQVTTPLFPLLEGDDHIDLDHLPVGQRFKAAGFWFVNPHGDERAIFHLEGAGVQVRREYAHDGVGYLDDDGAWATATEPGPIQMWIEFLGTTSEVRTLHAVAAAPSSSSSSSSSSSPPTPSAGGCNVGGSPGASGWFALLALAILLTRRAWVR